MTAHICPSCHQKALTWTVDEEISPLTNWHCSECGFHCTEDEKLEVNCPACGCEGMMTLTSDRYRFQYCVFCQRKRVRSVKITGTEILTWEDFHRISSERFGFPDFYGKNMDAWIDCMSSLGSSDGMTNIDMDESGTLLIEISDARTLKEEAPEIFDALRECSAFVNFRNQEFSGTAGTIALSYHV